MVCLQQRLAGWLPLVMAMFPPNPATERQGCGRGAARLGEGGTVEEVSLLPSKVRGDSDPSVTSTAPTQTTCWNIAANTPTCSQA